MRKTYKSTRKFNDRKYLEAIELPSEVKEGIRSRSSMLEATLKTISKEDLIQEGLVLVYSILADKPDAPLLYIMKAINNHYIDIQRSVIDDRNFTTTLHSDNVEKELDTRAFREFQKRPKIKKLSEFATDSLLAGQARGQIEAVILMQKEGRTFKEISEYLAKDPKTIKKLLERYGKETYGEEKKKKIHLQPNDSV